MFKNKRGEVRSGWKIAVVMGTILVITFIISSVIGAIISVFLISANGGIQRMMDDMAAVMQQWQWVLNIVQSGVMIAVVVFAWKKIVKRDLTEMGLPSLKRHKGELGWGLLFGIVSITIVFAVLVLTGNAQVASWTPSFSAALIQYLLVFIMVGFSEEIFFRGFVMATLRQTRSIAVVVFVSSVFFSLAHSLNASFSLIPFINIVLVAGLFAYMYLQSGNIWMAIGFHITWNYFQGQVFGMPVSGMQQSGMLMTQYAQGNILNGGGFGPEGGLVATAIILLGFLFVRWYYRDKTYQFIITEQEVMQSNTDGGAIDRAE